jgi:hypothetical protein
VSLDDRSQDILVTVLNRETWVRPVSSTTSSKPSPTGLIVASGVETSRKSTTSVTPGEAMMNMGLDPAKVALLAITPHFEWNWRVYCAYIALHLRSSHQSNGGPFRSVTIAFTAFMAIVAIILILDAISEGSKTEIPYQPQLLQQRAGRGTENQGLQA